MASQYCTVPKKMSIGLSIRHRCLMCAEQHLNTALPTYLWEQLPHLTWRSTWRRAHAPPRGTSAERIAWLLKFPRLCYPSRSHQDQAKRHQNDVHGSDVSEQCLGGNGIQKLNAREEFSHRASSLPASCCTGHISSAYLAT